ncbi:MAG: T9SS type A sorting domain-containing protein [Phaeodactylibacter sp.]|nr:T9SS type A sorting domain-containing protein [Phaeodactylibacter sp.]
MNKGLTFLACLFAMFWTKKMSAQQCGAIVFYDTPGILHDCAVPAGINQMNIIATGADGGERGSARFGGAGGSVSAAFNVTPGDHIRVIIGEAGEDGAHAAGGGGGTAVINCGNPQNCAGGTLLVVAGGGGGAGRLNGGGASSSAGGGNGGNADLAGSGGGINSGGSGCGQCADGVAGLGAQASNTAMAQAGTNSGPTQGSGGAGYGGGGAGNYYTPGGVQRHSGGGGGGYSGGDGGSDDGSSGVDSGGKGGSNFVRSTATAVTNSSGADGGSGGDNTDGTVTLEFSLVLPVELAQFAASFDEGQVGLAWQTATERDNAGFDIQRSADGRSWQTLAFLPGHGTTQQERSYSYTDGRPLSGINYYRLKQIDYDGQFEYSRIVSVTVNGKNDGIHFYPNPAEGSVTLAFEASHSGDAVLILYNAVGQAAMVRRLSLEPGAFQTDIELDGLPGGMYLVEMRAGRAQWAGRFQLR